MKRALLRAINDRDGGKLFTSSTRDTLRYIDDYNDLTLYRIEDSQIIMIRRISEQSTPNNESVDNIDRNNAYRISYGDRTVDTNIDTVAIIIHILMQKANPAYICPRRYIFSDKYVLLDPHDGLDVSTNSNTDENRTFYTTQVISETNGNNNKKYCVRIPRFFNYWQLVEITCLSLLEHPSILPIVDIFFYNNIPSIIYEMPTGTLQSYIKTHSASQDPFRVRQRERYALQCLGAVSHILLNGIWHRSLSPEHILWYNEQDTVKIAGFFDSVIGSVMCMTRFCFYGTHTYGLGYRPPEVLLGAIVYQPNQDIWSIGAIIFHLLTGIPLHPVSVSDDENLEAILSIFGTDNAELKQLPQYEQSKFANRDIPANLSVFDTLSSKYSDWIPLLHRMLSINPSDRPSPIELEEFIRSKMVITSDNTYDSDTTSPKRDNSHGHISNYVEIDENNRLEQSTTQQARESNDFLRSSSEDWYRLHTWQYPIQNPLITRDMYCSGDFKIEGDVKVQRELVFALVNHVWIEQYNHIRGKYEMPTLPIEPRILFLSYYLIDRYAIQSLSVSNTTFSPDLYNKHIAFTCYYLAFSYITGFNPEIMEHTTLTHYIELIATIFDTIDDFPSLRRNVLSTLQFDLSVATPWDFLILYEKKPSDVDFYLLQYIYNNNIIFLYSPSIIAKGVRDFLDGNTTDISLKIKEIVKGDETFAIYVSKFDST